MHQDLINYLKDDKFMNCFLYKKELNFKLLYLTHSRLEKKIYM